ncbi:hypothetical protein HHK36_022319 [Tetracentron sinense]|uniref:SAM domain-containing protein n=1 Tax=Tetracentron sinense TaxID=13715 RepID=A0A834YMT1_TETSI|nr:hypothetical protein HHK36_022319 [Tetracentron sinense]
MYADRVASGSKRSVKERLNGNSEEDFGRMTQINGKSHIFCRQRQNDEKWEHDLYDDEPQVSNRKVGVRDLRLKLQKKGSQQVYQSGKGSLAGGSQDLREKLSGTMHSQPGKIELPKAKPVLEAVKPARKIVSAEAPVPETQKVSNLTISRQKAQQKAHTSVDGFLKSLGLEKYLITFQAEEIDMTALIHMTDEDLKALGIPMVNPTRIFHESWANVILHCFEKRNSGNWISSFSTWYQSHKGGGDIVLTPLVKIGALEMDSGGRFNGFVIELFTQSNYKL